MSSETVWIQVQTTVSDEETAGRLASDWVERSLAACVQLHRSIQSTYRWKGQVESATEWLLVAKTHISRWDDFVGWSREHHPYECPELIATALLRVSDDYAKWMSEQLKLEA